MADLADIRFRYNEQDNVRVPKLQRLLEHLIASEEITLDDAIMAIAALTPAADQYIYYTGATTAALGTITGYVRTILDDPDAATVRATIGAEGSIAAGTAAQYWRGDKSWQTLDKAAVGLANVDNTSDANKPVSTATQTALDAKLDDSQASVYGLSLLGSADAAAAKTLLALAKGDVGLGNVDNTSDANKPVSTATQTALNLKLDASAVSAFALTFLDDANAAAVRTTLGLGTAATQNTGTSGANVPLLNGTNTWSGIQTISVAGAPFWVNSTNSNANLIVFQLAGVTLGTFGADATEGARFADSAGVLRHGFTLGATPTYRMNAVQVLTTRRTGWGAPTGTPTRTTFATGSVTLPQLAERVKALIDDLTTHGMIGP